MPTVEVQPKYVAGVLCDPGYSGHDDSVLYWSMTNDQQLALNTREDRVIFVDSMDALVAVLNERHPAPENMSYLEQSNGRITIRKVPVVLSSIQDPDTLFATARRHGRIHFDCFDMLGQFPELIKRMSNHWWSYHSAQKHYVDTLEKGAAQFLLEHDPASQYMMLVYDPKRANKVASHRRGAEKRLKKMVEDNYARLIPVGTLIDLWNHISVTFCHGLGTDIISLGGIRVLLHRHEAQRRRYSASILEGVTACKRLKIKYRIKLGGRARGWRKMIEEAVQYHPSEGIYCNQSREYKMLADLVRQEAKAMKISKKLIPEKKY